MKIGIIHDYLVSCGGAEKVFKALSDIFDADLFTLFYRRGVKNRLFGNREINTSFLQKFPFKKRYRWFLGFLTFAAESFDFRDYDLIISSSHSFAKGVITRVDTRHVCYCYSPTRYLWDSSLSNPVLNYFRIWDRQASERVDQFISCSRVVQDRIRKYYRRDSSVIYPPVDISSSPSSVDRGFYLIVSQLRRYKRVDIAVDAFNRSGLDLVIIGDGPERSRLERKSRKNIKFLGWQPDDVVRKYYSSCSGLLFPGEDDFGIAPVEAMGHGKPVLAFRKGGALETVVEGVTGEFFDIQHPAVLSDGIRRMREREYNPSVIWKHANKFGRDRFEREIKDFIGN
ncbi:MAG: glycosyltransferase [Candidatus Portnoybacteria bacterium]|nr:glycosyltransferase [Candidatus Portnoybacteria bacterium]